MPAELTVSRATLEDWRQVEEWAAQEEWNPGLRDTACFQPTDPAGFFLGRLRGRPVSAVSVVTYSDRFAFLGYYLVDPGHRGRGIGMATWRTALPHAGDRVIGLDAVPAQEAVYERSGFTSAHRTVRCAGRPPRTRAGDPVADAGVRPVTGADLDAITAYDQRCFPAERRAFLDRWLTVEGHTAYVSRHDGRVTGYGVMRHARDGQRIGPLFADTAEVAAGLFDALAGHLGTDDDVYMDIPETHEKAQFLAASRGLKPRSYTVRMYAGPVPPTEAERAFGVTSLELG